MLDMRRYLKYAASMGELRGDAELIALFEADQRGRRLTERTIGIRSRQLHALSADCGPLAAVKPKTLQLWLAKRQVTDRSRMSYLDSFRQYYAWAMLHGWAASNPALGVPSPRPRARERARLSDAEVHRAILEASSTALRCWVVLSAYQGLKCQEAANLAVEDVDIAAERLSVRHGGNGKFRDIRLHKVSAAALQNLPLPARGRLFSTASGPTVSQRISRHLDALGITGSSNSLRDWHRLKVEEASANFDSSALVALAPVLAPARSRRKGARGKDRAMKRDPTQPYLTSLPVYCDVCTTMRSCRGLYEHQVRNDEGVWIYTVLACERCGAPAMTVQEWQLGEDDLTEPERLYPPSRAMSIDGAPIEVRDAYEEAVRTFEHADAPSATAAMCRKAIEMLCNEQGASGRDLGSKLKKLNDLGVIDGLLTDWATQLRFVGNDAVHGDSVKRQDAQDALEFTGAILTYVYTYKKSFEEFKARREKSRGTSKGAARLDEAWRAKAAP